MIEKQMIKKPTMELLTASWVDDGIIGPCKVRYNCGFTIEFETLADGMIIVCDECGNRMVFRQYITYSFIPAKDKEVKER